MGKPLHGIDRLRAMHGYFDWCNETFNQRFTVRELEAIWDAARANPERDLADTWTDEEMFEALKGVEGSEVAADLAEQIAIDKANNWRDSHGS